MLEGISVLEKRIYTAFLSSRGITIDSRGATIGKMFFALKGENFDGNIFARKAIENGALYAVVDKDSEIGREAISALDTGNSCDFEGIDRYIVVEDTLIALQNLARCHRSQFNIPIIALTGTNGKTTTKELLTAVLSTKFQVTSTTGNLNNHIGVPLTLLEITSKTEVAIIEMGASSISEIDTLARIALPTYGLVTNVGKAHLQGFGTFEGVKTAKGELYDYLQRTGDTAFYNVDNPHLLQMVSLRPDLKLVPYGSSYQETNVLACDSQYPFLRLDISISGEVITVSTNLIGSYNAENVIAALCVGNHFGVSNEGMLSALYKYQPTNSRSQLVKTKLNTVIIDTYNANPSSMCAALDNFRQIVSENKIIILGDMLELGEDSYLEHQDIIALVEEIISAKQVERAYLVGYEFQKIEKVNTDNMFFFNNVEELEKTFTLASLANKLILLKGSNGINLKQLAEVL